MREERMTTKYRPGDFEKERLAARTVMGRAMTTAQAGYTGEDGAFKTKLGDLVSAAAAADKQEETELGFRLEALKVFIEDRPSRFFMTNRKMWGGDSCG